MIRLSEFQRRIVSECMEKRSGCLAVPMGTGKTLISLEVAQHLPGTGPILIVMSKSLVHSWVTQIKKFYKSSLSYQIFHKEYMAANYYNIYKPSSNSVVLTTPDVTSTCFKNLGLDDYVDMYNELDGPMSSKSKEPGNFLYSTKWKCIIIDEIQKYTMQKSLRCISLYNIYAKYRWLLSGTPINEPRENRLLGYYRLLGDYTFPSTPVAIRRYVKSSLFPGLNATMVIRSNSGIKLPESKCVVIAHNLTPVEQKAYDVIRKTIDLIIEQYGYNDDPYQGIVLTLIIYLRQFIVTPYKALASTFQLARKSEDILDPLKDEYKSLMRETSDFPTEPSSRINAVNGVLDNHFTDKVVIFSCFKSSITTLKKFIRIGRPIFQLESKQSISDRAKTLEKFSVSTNGILLLTYSLGAEGLNLQCAHTTLLIDFWWNDGVTQQAIARVLRRGQTSAVNIYFFTSNTGLENGLFRKHESKLRILNELGTGHVTKYSIARMRVGEILKLIRTKDNRDMIINSCPGK